MGSQCTQCTGSITDTEHCIVKRKTAPMAQGRSVQAAHAHNTDRQTSANDYWWWVTRKAQQVMTQSAKGRDSDTTSTQQHLCVVPLGLLLQLHDCDPPNVAVRHSLQRPTLRKAPSSKEYWCNATVTRACVQKKENANPRYCVAPFSQQRTHSTHITACKHIKCGAEVRDDARVVELTTAESKGTENCHFNAYRCVQLRQRGVPAPVLLLEVQHVGDGKAPRQASSLGGSKEQQIKRTGMRRLSMHKVQLANE